MTVFEPYEGPCYRCLFPEPPPAELAPSCAEGGVLGVLPGIIGTLQATEALKLMLGIGEPLVGRLLLSTRWTWSSARSRLRRDPNCPVCGDHPTDPLHRLRGVLRGRRPRGSGSAGGGCLRWP